MAAKGWIIDTQKKLYDLQDFQSSGMDITNLSNFVLLSMGLNTLKSIIFFMLLFIIAFRNQKKINVFSPSNTSSSAAEHA